MHRDPRPEKRAVIPEMHGLSDVPLFQMCKSTAPPGIDVPLKSDVPSTSGSGATAAGRRAVINTPEVGTVRAPSAEIESPLRRGGRCAAHGMGSSEGQLGVFGR